MIDRNQRINNAFVEIESRIKRDDGSALVILHRLVNKELEQERKSQQAKMDKLDNVVDRIEEVLPIMYEHNINCAPLAEALAELWE